MELQSELRDTEDKVQASRRFTRQCSRLNTLIQQFPTNLVANHEIHRRQFFEVAEADQREAPKVSFLIFILG